VPIRYPEDLQKIVALYPESVARDYLEKTEEVIQWLKHHPNEIATHRLSPFWEQILHEQAVAVL
jgi:hypothetical protein